LLSPSKISGASSGSTAAAPVCAVLVRKYNPSRTPMPGGSTNGARIASKDKAMTITMAMAMAATNVTTQGTLENADNDVNARLRMTSRDKLRVGRTMVAAQTRH
jgi:hypothetical protein